MIYEVSPRVGGTYKGLSRKLSRKRKGRLEFSRIGVIAKFLVEFSIGGKILAALLGRGLEMEVEGNPVAHLQRTKRVCVSKCSYMEIGYPLPCDSHV